MRYLKSIYALTIFTFLSFNLFSQLADVNEGCATLEVTFTAPSGSTFFWDFGDGRSSNQRNPVINYLDPGTYTVEFRNSQGGTVIDSETITVYPKPEISFTGDPQGGCVPLTTSLTDASAVDPNVTITGFRWTLGDGTSATGNPITHTYNTPGSYKVSLQLQSDLPGCTVTGEVDDFITTSSLTASFTADNLSACTGPLTVNFTNTTPDAANNLMYAWDLGNGNTSTARNPPAQTYTADGAYPVVLTVTDPDGCAVMFTQIVNIGNPLVDFNVEDTICSGIQITMDNTSSVGTYLWDFGAGADPMSSTERNPDVLFNNKQDYTISLTVTDPDGCESTTTKTVHVDMVFGDFVTDPAFSCNLPQDFTFTVTDPSALNVIWTYPDMSQSTDLVGSYSIEEDPTIYGRNGEQTFITTSTVFNDRGCRGFFADTFMVHVPNALFTVDTTMGCAPLTVTFYDSLSTAHENIVTYTYDWGDGTENTFFNNDPVTHTYTTAGDFEPFLIIENASGCRDTSYAIPVFVGAPVMADFTADKSTICAGDTVTFMGTGDPEIDAWHFDTDGSRLSHCADDANPSWVFNSMTGTMDVELTVLYNGCPTTVSKSDFITVNGPIAEIDYRIDCDAPFNVLFENLSKDATDGTWTLGNGDMSTLVDPTITYARGDYQVILEATNDMSGCPASYDTAMISIRNLEANFELEEFYCIGNPFDLDATMSTDVNADCWKGYTWFPSDQRPITTQDSIIEYAWGGRDTQWMELVVEDINGCLDTLRDTTLVIETIGDFSADPIRLCATNDVSFTDLSTSDTTIVEWMWDFGDGQIDSTNQNPTHTYTDFPDNGGLTVNLTVTDVLECEGTASLDLEFYEPESQITINDSEFCVGEVLEFSASDFTQEGSFLTYEWTFNGQPVSSTNSGQLTLNEAGSFRLEVVFTEVATGCQSTRFANIGVQDFPDATFTSNLDANPINCAGQIDFTNTGNNDPNALGSTAYSWDPGDGSPLGRNFGNFSHSYSRGTYTMTLFLETTFGCADTFMRDYTFVEPEGTLVASPLEICPGEEVTFNVVDTVDVNSFRIDFGDGTTADNTSPVTHVYSGTQNSYQASLIMEQVIDNLTCEATDRVTISVENINAGFSPSAPAYCPLDDVEFVLDNPDLQNNPDYDFTWDFGDGNTSNSDNPTHVYSNEGTYTITLTIRNNKLDCEGTASFDVNINANVINAAFSTDREKYCLNDLVLFTIDDPSINANDFDFNWNFGDGNTSTSFNPTHQYSDSGEYDVILTIRTGNGGCTGTFTETVDVSGDLGLEITPTTTVCSGVPVTLTVSSNRGDVNDWMINWTGLGIQSGSSGSPVITVIPTTSPAEYNVTVERPDGCSEEAMTTINVFPIIDVPNDTFFSVVTEPLVPASFTDSLDLLFTDFQNLLNISWRDSSQLNLEDRFQPIYTPGLNEGDSLVFVANINDANGCYTGRFVQVIELLQIPNIFSPNNDMRNRYFDIIGDYNRSIVQSFKVFNRWGQVVYNNETPLTGWDGTFNNEDQPVDVYVYIIELRLGDGSIDVKTGDVTLLR